MVCDVYRSISWEGYNPECGRFCMCLSVPIVFWFRVFVLLGAGARPGISCVEVFVGVSCSGCLFFVLVRICLLLC